MKPGGRFLHGLRAGHRALQAPRELVNLLQNVHADLVDSAEPPSASLLQLCGAHQIAVLHGGQWRRSANHPDPTSESLSIRLQQFRKPFQDAPDRDEWAAEALDAVRRARESAEGICIADAEDLLDTQSSGLMWHVACCYRRIAPAASLVSVPVGSRAMVVPVETSLNDIKLSQLDIRWELKDAEKVVARGQGSGQDNPPAIVIPLRVTYHPDNFIGVPRVSIRCHAVAAVATSPVLTVDGDILHVRRRAPEGASQTPRSAEQTAKPETDAPVQLGGQGPELARLEVALHFELPVSCSVDREPSTPFWSKDGFLNVALSNRTNDLVPGELRLTLHGHNGKARSVIVSAAALPPRSNSTFRVQVRESWLDFGANYVMAALRTPAGIDLTARLLYRNEGHVAVEAYRNPRDTPVRFWIRYPGERLPRKIELDGKEEKVLAIPSGDDLRMTAVVPEWFDRWVENIRSHSTIATGSDLQSIPVSVTGNGSEAEAGCWSNVCSAPGQGSKNHLHLQWCPDGLVWCRWTLAVSDDGCSYRLAWLQLPALEDGPTERVRWRRTGFWDCYPRSHPDAPQGECAPPVHLTRVERAELLRTNQVLNILSGGSTLQLEISSRLFRIAASPVPPGGAQGVQVLEFGLVPSHGEGLTGDLVLNKPSWVEMTSG